MSYFHDAGRLADLINGLLCAGEQVVEASDLAELDSQTGAASLHELLDFRGILPKLRHEVNDYRIHLCEVRKFENAEVQMN